MAQYSSFAAASMAESPFTISDAACTFFKSPETVGDSKAIRPRLLPAEASNLPRESLCTVSICYDLMAGEPRMFAFISKAPKIIPESRNSFKNRVHPSKLNPL
jgi:hypothetical protein